MKKTYNEIELELKQTQHELDKTKNLLQIFFNQIRLLQKENDNLKQQLNKNSKNSSKPPSTDQKSNTSDKNKKKRKGRIGKNRLLFSQEHINSRVECCSEKCPCCGSLNIESLSKFEILQQVELPEVQALITEYILKKYQCRSCGKNFKANLPEGIPNSAFGLKLMGLISTLTGVYHLAKREAIQLVKDLYDIDIRALAKIS